MKLPVINSRSAAFYPEDFKCPVCSQPLKEPNSFLVVNGGAMKRISRNFSEGVCEDLRGFLDIRFYGPTGKGLGKYKNKAADREIVRNSKGGQFDLNFCSTDCLRIFVNSIIDDMEKELNKPKRKQKK